MVDSCTQALNSPYTCRNKAVCNKVVLVLRRGRKSMRRSQRLSVKHEIRLASKADFEHAEAAAAAAHVDAPQELSIVVPSTVTKAIAGLATPHLPSPSTFPEDWRMFTELLQDGSVRVYPAIVHCFLVTTCAMSISLM